MFKVNSRNTETKYELSLKVAIKAPEGSQCSRSGVFIVNFEYFLDTAVVFS